MNIYNLNPQERLYKKNINMKVGTQIIELQTYNNNYINKANTSKFLELNNFI